VEEKKTLVLTPGQRHLNAEAGKGRVKKNPVIIPRQPAGKGRKEKKTLVLTLGSSPEKGEKKKKIVVLTLGSAI
jgi:hypothetical protein